MTRRNREKEDSPLEPSRVSRIRAGSADGGEDFAAELLRALRDRKDPFERYELKRELAHGGQGAVVLVEDHDLRRELAMKVVRTPASPAKPGSGDAEALSRTIGRFVEEAQVTGQLDHPGIVPVHELGVDEEDRFYFTMKLVKGETLGEVFARVHAADDEAWTFPRALGVLLKICEAMRFAHDRRILHRDLKPENVMVGRYGEVFVMDWGLAHLLDREETKDIRIRQTVPRTKILSTRRDFASESPGSPLMTVDGTILGTPAYMPPEQAFGDLEAMGTHSDVYSLGALLYHLLTGRAPYQPPDDERWNNLATLREVQHGPPKPVTELAPDTAPELVTICERAMARRVEDRFATVAELERNLRAFVEDRVVPAHRTGALIELAKWVHRNRGLAAAIAGIVLVTLMGALGVARSEASAARVAQASERNTQLFLDERLASDLPRQAEEELWPVQAATVERIDHWLAQADAFLERTEGYRAELAEVRARALPEDGGEAPADGPGSPPPTELEKLRERHAEFSRYQGVVEEVLADPERVGEVLDQTPPELLSSALAQVIEDGPFLREFVPFLASVIAREEARLPGERRTWRFADALDNALHERLTTIVHGARVLEQGGVRAEVLERRARAEGLQRETVDDHARAWEQAIASIADVGECPPYEGLELVPQVGLVPLRRDPASGLWEFWHVLSGARPVVGDDGEYVVERDTGVVLVLIPPGYHLLGVQNYEPSMPRYDGRAKPTEGDPFEVELDAYFVSKYELTAAQWFRASGELPNEFFVGFKRHGGRRILFDNPVESVSWLDCERVLARWELELPTEAQWETAARGGTDTAYWWGSRFDPQLCNSLTGADETKNVSGPDGHFVHWPVDTARPNPFGLYNVLGNVAEWCRDWHVGVLVNANGLEPEVTPGTGEMRRTPVDSKSRRGGSWRQSLLDVRVSGRYKQLEVYKGPDLGVRPVRTLVSTPPEVR